jgi:hypothetical protein
METWFRVIVGAMLLPVMYVPYALFKGLLFPLLRETTVLHMAALLGSRSLTELLCTVGYDPNKEDDEGYRPLDNAILKDRLGVARILIRYGANVVAPLADTPSEQMRELLHATRSIVQEPA